MIAGRRRYRETGSMAVKADHDGGSKKETAHKLGLRFVTYLFLRYSSSSLHPSCDYERRGNCNRSIYLLPVTNETTCLPPVDNGYKYFFEPFYRVDSLPEVLVWFHESCSAICVGVLLYPRTSSGTHPEPFNYFLRTFLG